MTAFDAKAIEAVLAAWKPLARRAAAAKPSREDVEKAYGGRVPDDLAAIISLHERHVLQDLAAEAVVVVDGPHASALRRSSR